MDLSTLIGLVIGFGTVVVVLILDGGHFGDLFSVPQSIFLIFSGSMSATAISVGTKVFKTLPKLLTATFFQHKSDPSEAIELLTRMADKARREGLLALEEESKKIKDPFLQKGIMLVVDGVDPAQVRSILETNIENLEERHKKGATLFINAGGFSPTFGIIGTVMGLMHALKLLDDPKKLAEAIAGAFLATLWGLLWANLIFLPLGNKLKAKSQEEVHYRYLLTEGILALQAGENPRIVREKLNAFLAPKEIKSEDGKKKSTTATTEKVKA
ncbi:MAG: motility protein A [Chloroflexi bacterium HGW-Chloroflexi-5]|jgi:chemotaxis protein MotA|nr:MAG: motility protein A [Chloroflexi bacterium HGW-Chloroflexi-5]